MSYESIYRSACGDNLLALDFLVAWNLYCHQIDDLVDQPVKNPELLLDTLALANILYSTAFYQANISTIRPVVMSITSAFADSIAWEKSQINWQKKWADQLRFSGNEMVLIVVGICGGYSRMREVSLALREDSWNNHHNEGKPI